MRRSIAPARAFLGAWIGTGVERLVRRALEREPVERDVDGDAIEPGAERRISLELAERAIGADERVLRQIARVLVIADEAKADLIDAPPIAFDDEIERVALAVEGGLDERAIIGLLVESHLGDVALAASASDGLDLGGRRLV